MPELPEVQTVINSIKLELAGKTICSTQNPNGYIGVFENGNLNDYKFFLDGKKIVDLKRRGKFIIFQFHWW